MRYIVLVLLIVFSFTPLSKASAQDPDLLLTIPAHRQSVGSVAVSPDGRYVASASATAATVHDSKTGKLIASIVIQINPDREAPLPVVTFAADNNTLYILVPKRPRLNSAEVALLTWHIPTNRITDTLEITDFRPNAYFYASHLTKLVLLGAPGTSELALGFSVNWTDVPPEPDGSSGHLFLFDTKTGTIRDTLQAASIISAAFSATGTYLFFISGSVTSFHIPGQSEYDDTFYFYKLEKIRLSDRAVSARIASEKSFSQLVRPAPNNNYLVFSTLLHDLIRTISVRPLSLQHITDGQMLPTGTHFLAALPDTASAGILDIHTNTWIRRYEGAPATAFAAASDQRLFATGDAQGNVSIFALSILDTLRATPLTASFATPDTLVRLDDFVHFFNSSYPLGTEATFAWDFGDGQTSTEFEPVHRYTRSGKFTVRLVVQNNDGTADTLVRPDLVTVPDISPAIVWWQTTDSMAIADIAYSSDGKFVISAATAGRNALSVIRDAMTGKEFYHKQIKRVYGVALTALPDNKVIVATTSAPPTCYIGCYTFTTISVPSGLVLTANASSDASLQYFIDSTSNAREMFIYTDQGSICAAASPDGMYVAGGTEYATSTQYYGEPVYFWQYAGTNLLFNTAGVMQHHENTPSPLASTKAISFSPTNRYYATAGRVSQYPGGHLVLRDVHGAILQTVENIAIHTLSFSPTDTNLVATNAGFWHLSTNTISSAPISNATDIMFTPDGRYLIAVFADEDSAAAILDVQSRQWKYWYISHPSKQTCLAIAPDGRHFATGAADGSVTVWDIPQEFWPDSTTSDVQQNGQQPQLQASVVPNPVGADGCTIHWVQPQTGHTSIAVYDMFGRSVATIFDNRSQHGEHTVQWSGPATGGTAIAPGIYFCRIQAAGQMTTLPIILHQ